MAAQLPLTPPVDDVDHVLGSPSAPVTLVQYGDYECPHSAEGATIVKELRLRLGEQLRFVFRHYPLTGKHPLAQQAAEAVEAAAAQGRFWEMHTLLFASQPQLDSEHLRDYARQLQLDMARFEQDLAHHTYAGRVARDVTSGERSGVEGTPTYFVNSRRHDGPEDLVGLMAGIDRELAKFRPRQHAPDSA
jgi:protein-disulfide isomerase